MRMLLVEDDPIIGNGLQQALRQEHYAVDWVTDGTAADLALRTNTYNLLLLDLGLPCKSGMEILNKLRRQKSTLPVIIITARDGLPDRLAGLNNGADDYLVKPFAFEELIARIRAVIRRQSGQVQLQYVAGEIRLDPARHQVWLRDELVAVSAREFSILEILMQEAGKVFSRERLEESIYAWGAEVVSNAVEVHIHNLRKKLGAEAIRTVRGVGYRVSESTPS